MRFGEVCIAIVVLVIGWALFSAIATSDVSLETKLLGYSWATAIVGGGSIIPVMALIRYLRKTEIQHDEC